MDQNDQPTLDHLRVNWTAQLEDIAVYFPDENAMVNRLDDVDAQIVLCIAFKAARRLIIALEQRNQDLEKVLKIVNEPETRPSPLEELGHARGLDMLQILNSAIEVDLASGQDYAIAGIRRYEDRDTDVVMALVKRGYVGSHALNCWITRTGMEYLKDLKHELRK